MKQHEKLVRKYVDKLETIALVSTSLFLGTILASVSPLLNGIVSIHVKSFPDIILIAFGIMVGSFFFLLFLGLINHLYFRRQRDVYDDAYYDGRRDLKNEDNIK